jgi:hypothetical protein
MVNNDQKIEGSNRMTPMSTQGMMSREDASNERSSSSNPAIAPKPTQPAAPITAEMMERRKNEIVNAMLVKIRPFVGPGGAIKPDVDFDRLAAVMLEETEFLGRTLILTVLLSSTAMPPDSASDEAKAIVFLLCDRFGKSKPCLEALQKWLSEGVKGVEPTVHLSGKILELLGRLHLGVDQLVEFKFGKMIKKLQHLEMAGVDTRAKADRLFEEWSQLAKAEDRKEDRKNSTESTASVSRPRPAEVESGRAVENLDLFAASSTAQPSTKTRAAMILERAASSQPTRKTSLTTAATSTRPLSADDIHKAKKRKQYLQEAVASGTANPDDLESLGILDEPAPTKILDRDIVEERMISPPPPPPPSAERRSKRVSFANEEELVQIRLFEPYDEESDEHRRTKKKRGIASIFSPFDSNLYLDYHHADRQEASYAFQQSKLEMMEPEIPWPFFLTDLEIPADIQRSHGEESVEASRQEQRERRTVSANYFSVEHVPPSPAEDQVTEGEALDPGFAGVKTIPDTGASGSVQKIFIGQQPPPALPGINAVPNLGLDPATLAVLLGGQVPPSAIPMPAMQARPPIPFPFMPPPQFPLPVAGAANIIRPPPFMFPPPPLPGFTGVLPPPPPGSFGVRPAFPFSQRQGPGHDPSKLKTKPCKFYKSNTPGSCRFGESCNFAHVDLSR